MYSNYWYNKILILFNDIKIFNGDGHRAILNEFYKFYEWTMEYSVEGIDFTTVCLYHEL